MTRPNRAIARQGNTASRLVTCFALFAFFLQGFAVQTHVHQLIQPVLAKVAAAATPSVQAPTVQNQLPAPIKVHDPLDQGNCRLCHELIHAGAFVTPAVAALSVGLTYVTARIIALAVAPGTPAQAFSWQSRAPPQH